MSSGLFVGSGVVEAGCKSIIGQRLKPSGMHWNTADADAVITLPSGQQTVGKPSATGRTLRRESPDQPQPEDDLDYLQI
jgi:hypothetical protein